MILRGTALPSRAFTGFCRPMKLRKIVLGQPPLVPAFSFACTGPEVDDHRRIERLMSCTWVTEPKGTQLLAVVCTMNTQMVQLHGHATRGRRDSLVEAAVVRKAASQ